MFPFPNELNSCIGDEGAYNQLFLPLKVPKALGNLFNRAIDGRRMCTEWYTEHLHGDASSNQRHNHFADILTAAWEFLRPLQESYTPRTKLSAPATQGATQPTTDL